MDIRMENDSIIVNNLVIEDPDIVDFFSDLEEDEREKQIIAALKIGTVGLKNSATSIDVNYVEKEFQKFKQQVKDEFETVKEEWDEDIEDVFGDKGKLDETFEELDENWDDNIDEVFGEEGKIKKLLDPHEDSSPISKLRKSIDEKFAELNKSLGVKEGIEEEKEKGTRKGREFEDVVWNHINDITSVFGDVPDKTGDIPGIADSKKGDITVTLNPDETHDVEKNIVFEVKNRSVQFGGKGCITHELEEAKENRKADVSVLVINEKHEPSETGAFSRWDPETYVCTIPEEGDRPIALEVAYRAARVKTLQSITGKEIGFDQKEVDRIIAELKDKVDLKRSVYSNLTSAEKNLDNVRENFDTMVEDINSKIIELEACFTSE